jgi:BirA family transcriptional regulator, biotin operon repressor / biotin---[acetyl-CoA-carboxylase] ligase
MVSRVEGARANFAAAFEADWRGSGFAVAHVAETGSTNADLLAAAGELPSPCALVADHQHAGRGRHDRRWAAPPGASLLVSLLLSPPPEPTRPQLAVLTAGVALVDACRERAGVDAALKWPNDVVLADGPAPGKLAGVLAETRFEGGRVAALVVGVGCNLHWPATAGGGGDAAPGATSVRAAGGRPVTRDDLLETWLRAVGDGLAQLAGPGGPARVRAAWLARSDTIGRRVRVIVDGGELVGEAVDLTDDGGLLVVAEGVPVEVSVGDVEHLRPV